jgi:hypothetical protein
MSEFADSFVNDQRYNDSYNEAIARAQGIAQKQESIRQKLTDNAMRKYEDEKQKQDTKYEELSASLEALGLAPLHHGTEGLIDSAKEAFAKKVSKTAQDLLDRGGEEVRNRLSKFIQDKGLNITPEELADKIKNRLKTTADGLQENARDALNKVQDGVKNVVDTGARTFDQVAGNVDNATRGALEQAGNSVDTQVEGRLRGVRQVINRNPRQNIRARGISDEERAERYARGREQLARRRAGVQIEGDELTRDVAISQEDLDRVRAQNSVKLEPATLGNDDVDQALSQDDFRNMARNGWRMDADASLRSTNPYSPYNNANFKEGVEDFKEFGSLREKRAAARIAKNKARLQAIKDNEPPPVENIDAVPERANEVAPQRLYGRGLDRGNVQPDAGDFKPSVGEYEIQKADAEADLRESGLTIRPSDVKASKLASVNDIQNNEKAFAEAQARQDDVNQANAEAQANQQVLDHNTPPARGQQNDFIGGDQPDDQPARPRNGNDLTNDSGDNPVNEAPKPEPKPPAPTTTEGEGENIADDILKGGEKALTTDAELGGPEDFIGDGISALVGLGTILGGIFGGHHKDPSPPSIHMPTPPAPINPGASFGI